MSTPFDIEMATPAGSNMRITKQPQLLEYSEETSETDMTCHEITTNKI